MMQPPPPSSAPSASQLRLVAAAAGVCVLLGLAAIAAGRWHAAPPAQQHAASQPQKQQPQPQKQQPQKQQPQQQQQQAEDDAELLEECVAFLQRHLPARDRGRISADRLRQHAALALAARRATAWAAAVPWEVFLNDVLPHRSVDEPLDASDWRPLFHARLSGLVAAAGSLTEAAQLINQHVWSVFGNSNGSSIHFVGDQTPEIMSVTQVLQAGYASCTGLSIFLVAACRAVGVPARVTGTPSWVEDRRESPEERFNNHCWVEVWDGAAWSFTGACEFNPAGLNRSWFFPEPAQRQRPGSVWNAIWAASYAATGEFFPLAWSPGDRSVPGLDVTQAYLDAPVLPSAAAVA